MSFGLSLMRRPGVRKERGTHVGASRRMPSPASTAWRTRARSALDFVLLLATCLAIDRELPPTKNRVVRRRRLVKVPRGAVIPRRPGAIEEEGRGAVRYMHS